MNKLWRLIRQPPVIVNAGKVALLVGTLLNVINQGEALLQWQGISWWHVALNYAVPFCVASYSAAKIQLENKSDGR